MVKTLIIIISLIVINIFDLQLIALNACFLGLVPFLFFNKKNIEFIIVLIISISLNNSFYTNDLISSIIWCFLFILIYKQKNIQWIYSNLFIGIVLTFCSYKLNSSYCIYPLIFTLANLPKISLKLLPLRTIYLYIFILFNLIILIICFFPEKTGRPIKSAYLNHGVWADTKSNYRLDSLTIANSYSYSEFCNLTNSTVINNIDNINDFNELWLITPTHPFTQNEILKIKKWVEKGGHLILISDHTDLFGHGRCVNQIGQEFGIKTNYSALFNKENNQIFKTKNLDNVVIKTATSFTGSKIHPLISSILWEEESYYGNDNFFGPLYPSGDDSFGIKTISAVKSIGLGQLTLLGDSTILSNFAIYQPFILSFIEKIREFNYFGRLICFLPLLICFAIYLLYHNKQNYIVIISIFFIPFLFQLIHTKKSIFLGNKVQIWSGNYKYYFENNCPFESISTAYSLASLSNFKPLYIEHAEKYKNVIWVDKTPPLNKDWRWIKIEDKHKMAENPKSLNAVTKYFDRIFVNDSFQLKYNKINVNSIFNDAVMNDWWFDNGISIDRQNRINCWIQWLNLSKNRSLNFLKAKQRFTNKKYKAVIKIDKIDKLIYTEVPKPLNNVGCVNFGNGIIGKIITNKKNKMSILGLHQYSENWYAPKIWIIDYEE